MDRRIDPRTLLEHAGWLKRLARSLVGDEDRAEDLVQQTWVATLKSPLRHPGAARAWLATVVRNFAFQARREERQRRKREASASRQELTTSTPDAAVERAELQKLVVDAVLELDDPYRTTVILRYFDELSLKEIAERQEIPVETVRTRLRRAAERLRTRLDRAYGGRREVWLAVAMPLACPGKSASASSGGGGILRGLLATKSMIALGLVVVSIAAVATWTLIRDDSPAREKPEVVTNLRRAVVEPVERARDFIPPGGLDSQASRDPAVVDDEKRDSGVVNVAHSPRAERAGEAGQPGSRVVDEESLPIEGARVILYYHRNTWGLYNGVVETTATDAAGHFTLTSDLTFLHPVGNRSSDRYFLCATHPGFASGWSVIYPGVERSLYTLTLTKPSDQSFLVTDRDGQPLVGARIWLRGAGKREEASRRFRDPLRVTQDLDLASATTDEAGRAVVKDIPRTFCTFAASLEGFADGTWGAEIPSQDEAQIYLAPAASVSGRLRTSDGTPVAGAEVWFVANSMSPWSPTLTDSEGRFSLDGLIGRGDYYHSGEWKGNGRYRVTIVHDEFTAPEHRIQLASGELLDDVNLHAVKGTLLRVKILEPGSDRPIPGALIEGFTESGRLRAISDANGVIERRVAPGRVRLHFRFPPLGRYVIRKPSPRDSVEVLASGDLKEATVYAPTELRGPLVSRRGRVVLANGDPAAGLKIRTSFAEDFYSGESWPRTTTDDEGRFEFARLPVGLQVYLYAETDDFRYILASVLELEDGSMELEEPLVARETGTADLILTENDRTPAREVDLRIRPLLGGRSLTPEDRKARTDTEGRLRIGGVLPGLEYLVRDARASFRRQEGSDYFHRTLTLIPGEPLQAPEEGEGEEEIEAADFTIDLPQEKRELSEPWMLTGHARTRYILEYRSSEQLVLPVFARLHTAARMERTEVIWGDPDETGNATVFIQLDSEANGRLYLGFFADPTWSSAPVQVRELPGSGTHRLEHVPPGDYWVAAVTFAGEPRPTGIGVHSGWPHAVTVGNGARDTIEVNVTPKLVHGNLRFHRTARGYAGEWGETNPWNLLEGTLTERDGRPVPFGRVQVQYFEGDGSDKITRSLRIGANQRGEFRYDQVEGRYRVSAQRFRPLLEQLGVKGQTVDSLSDYTGAQVVDLQFPAWPQGTAKLVGRVVDQNGRPVRVFALFLRSPEIMYQVPFLSADGSFEIDNLPARSYTVRASPFDPRLFDLMSRVDREPVTVDLVNGEISEIELSLPRKTDWYARLFFKGGIPLGLASHIWPDSSCVVSIRMAMSYNFYLHIGSVDVDGTLTAYLSEKDVERLRKGETDLRIHLKVEGRPADLDVILPFDRLSPDPGSTELIEIECPDWLRRKFEDYALRH